MAKVTLLDRHVCTVDKDAVVRLCIADVFQERVKWLQKIQDTDGNHRAHATLLPADV